MGRRGNLVLFRFATRIYRCSPITGGGIPPNY